MRARTRVFRICLFLMGVGSLSCSAGDAGSGSQAQETERRSALAEQLLQSSEIAGSESTPASGQCGASQDPVVIVVLDTRAAVRARRATEAKTPVVSEDADTVVFADGRILTAKLDEVGAHLTELGWGDRELVISSRFQKRGGAAKRRRRG